VQKSLHQFPGIGSCRYRTVLEGHMIVERNSTQVSVGLYNLFEHCSVYMSSNTWKFDANSLHLTISIQKMCLNCVYSSPIWYPPAIGANVNPFSQYARSKRPADSVHWHAPSVPANLGRRISERMGRLTLGPYWPASRSKCVGQPHVSKRVG